MSQEDRFEAPTAIRLPEARYDHLSVEVQKDYRSLANLDPILITPSVEHQLHQNPAEDMVRKQ